MQTGLRLTKGNLPSHLSKLEHGGLVAIQKVCEGRLPVTYVMLTMEGRQGLDEHWKRLDAIRRGARTWRPAKA